MLKAAFFAVLALLVLSAQRGPLAHAPNCDGHRHRAQADRPAAAPVGPERPDADATHRAAAPAHRAAAIATGADDTTASAAGSGASVCCPDGCCPGLCRCGTGQPLAMLPQLETAGGPSGKALVMPAASLWIGLAGDGRAMAGIRPPPQAPPRLAQGTYRAHFARTSRQLI